jgi:hypothetical protein
VIASGYGGKALKAGFKGNEHIAFLAKAVPTARNALGRLPCIPEMP